MAWEYGALLMLGMFMAAGIGVHIWLIVRIRRAKRQRRGHCESREAAGMTREFTITFDDDDKLPELIEAYAAHNRISVNHAFHRLLIEGLQGFGLRELSRSEFEEAESLDELFVKMGIKKPKKP